MPHVTPTGNVNLDGLRFLNDGTTTGGGASNPTLQIVTGDNGHAVTNSIFWSTVAGGANGVDDRAIIGNPSATGTISITDNLISGTSQGQFGTASWGRGIWFDGGGVDLVVTGNAIQWTRTGINLDMSGDSTVDDLGQRLPRPRQRYLGRSRCGSASRSRTTIISRSDRTSTSAT